MRARLHDLSPTFTGEQKLTILTDTDCRQLFDDLHESDVEVTIQKFREGRNKGQNGLYWKYLTQLAKVLRISNNRLHNMMLRQYGQPEYYDGKPACILIPDTEKAEEQAIEQEFYHIKPTSHVQTGADGIQYRVYMVMRGSSDLNTEEFSRLLDGLLEACEDMGIHIMTGRKDG